MHRSSPSLRLKQERRLGGWVVDGPLVVRNNCERIEDESEELANMPIEDVMCDAGVCNGTQWYMVCSGTTDVEGSLQSSLAKNWYTERHLNM